MLIVEIMENTERVINKKIKMSHDSTPQRQC